MQGFVSNLCQQQAAEAKNAKRTYGTGPLGEPRLVRKLSSSNPETSRSPTRETGNTRIVAQLREWSLAQTLRHTIFVVDAWYGHAAALRPNPFHPIGVPASFTTNGAEFGIDESAAPTLGEILAVRTERIADLRAYLAEVTQEELDRVRGPNTAIGCPPPAKRTAAECLRVIFSDEWAHVQFANRDLAILEEQHA
jgi:hypothetical protein